MKEVREYPVIATGEARCEQKALYKLGPDDQYLVELFENDRRQFDADVRYNLGLYDQPAPFDGMRYTHYYTYLTASRRYLTVVVEWGLSI